jgi:hypothetical protein
MISTKDQEDLFRLIADYIKKDITAIAIGGTAMMFLKYKTTTKDIDLVFKTKEERDIFIDAIEELGYRQKSLIGTYDERRRKSKDAPVMYSRGEERFDLFLSSVFGFPLDFSLDRITQRQDFIGKKELTIHILPGEYLILLKSVTSREKDYEDMETIVKAEKAIDWDLITDEAIRHRKVMQWMLIDLEEKMQRLRKVTLIKEKYFKKIYAAEESA